MLQKIEKKRLGRVYNLMTRREFHSLYPKIDSKW